MPGFEPVGASSESDLALPPPAFKLSKTERAFWIAEAPHAIAQQTLMAATAVGFRELCQQFALKEAIAKKILTLGAATRDADSYLRAYTKLAQRVDSSMARFKLTAFGKPDAGASSRKPAANPWAQVARP